MIVGYARVSTRGQDLTLQREALRGAACERIFQEKVSGKRADNRKQLSRLLGKIERGDVVIATKLDRIARSTRDLLNIIHSINEAGAQFKSLGDPWCDTTTPHGRLLLTVLAGLAEFERELIISRTSAGIEHAREIGKTFGRPVKLTDNQRKLVAERHARGETLEELATAFRCGKATVFRAVHASV
jgi:DNA invertase Pin-like site-specific DNA recombinase